MRRIDEVVQVEVVAGVPRRFRRPEVTAQGHRCRGPRWYRVQAVIGTWVEGAAWWRSRAARAVLALDPDPGPSPGPADSSGPAGSAGAVGERQGWRVEARPEKGAVDHRQVGVYELLHRGDGRWVLVRAVD